MWLKRILELALRLFFIACWQSMEAQSAPLPIRILTPIHSLPHDLIQKFQKESNTSVLVDFVSTEADIWIRLKPYPQNWDLVFALEEHSVFIDTKPQPVFVPFFHVPYGIFFIPTSIKPWDHFKWAHVEKINSFPHWRNHFHSQIPLEILQELQTKWIPTDKKGSWTEILEQNKAEPAHMPLPLLLMKKKAMAGIGSQRTFLFLKQHVENLDFIIPKEGSPKEKWGLFIIPQCKNEKGAEKFINFMQKHSMQWKNFFLPNR